MTVKELLERLEKYPPELLVHGVQGVGQHEEGGVVGVKVHVAVPPGEVLMKKEAARVTVADVLPEKVAPKKTAKR